MKRPVGAQGHWAATVTGLFLQRRPLKGPGSWFLVFSPAMPGPVSRGGPVPVTRGLKGEQGPWWWPGSHLHWRAGQGFTPGTPRLSPVPRMHTLLTLTPTVSHCSHSHPLSHTAHTHIHCHSWLTLTSIFTHCSHLYKCIFTHFLSHIHTHARSQTQTHIYLYKHTLSHTHPHICTCLYSHIHTTPHTLTHTVPH